jgi:tetratricopeptide (TPR) repeat protein
MGRFGVEGPAVEGGCDEWELDFAIAKHERYLEKHLGAEQTRSHNSIILEQVGHLYEKQGEFEKAIEYLKKAKEIRFFRPQDLQNEIERIQDEIDRVRK